MAAGDREGVWPGRAAGFVNGPRPLDLDILLFGDLMVSEPGLDIPHQGWPSGLSR